MNGPGGEKLRRYERESGRDNSIQIDIKRVYIKAAGYSKKRARGSGVVVVCVCVCRAGRALSPCPAAAAVGT